MIIHLGEERFQPKLCFCFIEISPSLISNIIFAKQDFELNLNFLENMI